MNNVTHVQKKSSKLCIFLAVKPCIFFAVSRVIITKIKPVKKKNIFGAQFFFTKSCDYTKQLEI